MRPTRDENLWELCDVVAKRGTCSRLQVGAVASRDGRVLVTGYNGAPAGMPHCYHTDNDPCLVAVHAEANLIAFAARHGVGLEDARLDCTDSPCLSCAQLIINAGFIEVCYHRLYRVDHGVDLLIQAGINVYPRNYEVVI